MCRSHASAAALALGLLAAACRTPPADPAERYRQFAAAAQGGDADAAWSMLSSDSQERLKARGEALSGGKPVAGVDLGPRQLLLGDLAPTAPKVKSVRVAKQEGDAAAVEVEVDGGARGQVDLRRENGEWRVVLPGR